MEIEGDFIIDSLTKSKFTQDFFQKRVKLNEVIDSLFNIYEEVGFFNVKFDLMVDTTSGDTVEVNIKPHISRLPSIKEVRTDGVDLPVMTLSTYFPFKVKVFRRKVVTSSFSILHNLGVISSGEYYFIPLPDKNNYALLLKMRPINEAFYINLLTGGDDGIMGDLSITHPSILSSGIGIELSAGFKNGTLNHYTINNTILIPGLKGIGIKFEAMEISDSLRVKFRGGRVIWCDASYSVIAGLEKINSTRYFLTTVGIIKPNWKSQVEFKGGNGWFLSYFIAFKDVINLKVEEGFAFFKTPHYIILNKPLRSFQEPIPPKNIIVYTVVRLTYPLENKFSLFTDFGIIKDAYFLDLGTAYVNEGYGIYLGYSIDSEGRKIKAGIAFGIRKSVFERSIRIL